MDERTLLCDLSRPEAWPGRSDSADTVQVLSTHVSRLFFVGDRVYKVKRPVDLGFVDFTDLEDRHRFCEEEVRLNRRLTVDVHLGVVPLVPGDDGRLRLGSAEEASAAREWAVEMRRLPAARMLDALFDRGEVDNARIHQLARLLTRFHADAATGEGVDEHGEPAAVRALVEENFTQVAPFVGELADGAPLTRERLERLAAGARGFLDRRDDLLRRRVAEGRIRDGHGDLHAGNVCCTDERIQVYDCIEFAPRLRCSDVAADLAFLCMDLDHRGYPGFSGYLATEYVTLSGDRELARLLPFYKGYRAVVRAKVASIASADDAFDAETRAAKAAEARSYFDLAVGYELPPCLVLACGLPATGKSTMARRLARSLRAAVHRSDVRRKMAAGIAPTERAGAAFESGLYSPERSERTYRGILERTVRELRVGRSVVVDASFARAALRRDFVDAAARLGVPWCLVWIEDDEAVVRERLRSRAEDAHEVSDADLDVYLKARDAFEPPTELAAERLVRVRCGAPSERVAPSLTLDRLTAVVAARG